jgi:hypothetical protein
MNLHEVCGVQEGLAVNPVATREGSCTAPVRRQPAPTHEEMEKLEKSMAALEKQYTAEHPLVRPRFLLCTPLSHSPKRCPEGVWGSVSVDIAFDISTVPA